MLFTYGRGHSMVMLREDMVLLITLILLNSAPTLFAPPPEKPTNSAPTSPAQTPNNRISTTWKTIFGTRERIATWRNREADAKESAANEARTQSRLLENKKRRHSYSVKGRNSIKFDNNNDEAIRKEFEALATAAKDTPVDTTKR